MDLDDGIHRLEVYQDWGVTKRIDFKSFVDSDVWISIGLTCRNFRI